MIKSEVQSTFSSNFMGLQGGNFFISNLQNTTGRTCYLLRKVCAESVK
ncbi:hypothetical protein RG47T_3209 [Mucilaginibacter polytrichastri]|uniref:Uncharacterized protein n=1 Tax=Mucilaginibacter polytrichastri TaxID=1302689 RepID=A0A1Q6A152_9SPHI|nr:hypothetical protein RG47T_3209 [Mucilaginibacter polytrichastri]